MGFPHVNGLRIPDVSAVFYMHTDISWFWLCAAAAAGTTLDEW